MATIAENLQTIQNIKQDIKRAIENKGVDMSNTPFTEYSTKIDEISSGGGTGGDTTNYSYLIPTGDVDGLKAIGWDDDSISYFRNNNLYYEWESEKYKISEENKSLYGIINNENYLGYENNPNLVFMPMIDLSKNYLYFRGLKYIQGIPLFKNYLGDTLDNSFYGCSQLITIPPFDTSNITSMANMFYGCSKLKILPKLNTSNVTNMNMMFVNCSSLTNIPQFNTSCVTNMDRMFYGCSSLQLISHLDTSKVRSMKDMFYGCSLLETIPELDTSNVENMLEMFYGCSNLKILPELKTDKVTNMSYMFYGCSSLEEIKKINTSSVITMNQMFYGCQNLKTIPDFNTSNVTDMSYMFYRCMRLEKLPLFDCGKIKNMTYFFGSLTLEYLTDLGGFKDLKISITSNFLDKTPKLIVESLMNVINNLYDLTANGISGKTLKFGSTNLNKLTAEQIAVATAKGWTLT